MAAPKKIAPPIDRPLSRSYLREFSGWSTAYPPGLSEPTSLRIMENMIVTQNGALAIRPALRTVLEEGVWLDSNYGVTAVGGIEPFYLNDGTKAFIFAVREEDSTVGFRIGKYDAITQRYVVLPIDDAQGFLVPQSVATLNFSSATTYVRYLQIDNKIFALSNAGEDMRMFWAGPEKLAKRLLSITEPDYVNADRLSVLQPTSTWVAGSQNTVPTAITPSTTTLTSTTATSNVYNFAFFYTFNNEIGESAPSMLTVMKTQRRWSAWEKDAANDAASADQIAAIIPNTVWTNAVSQGAISWNLYMLTWSDQDAVPVEATLLRTTSMVDKTRDQAGWATMTPLLEGLDAVMGLPNNSNRYNYSDPSSAAQGLVAGDRLVLVNDRNAAAVIRWSSNLQGDYTNFSSSKGGGYKTLTSGNIYIPASVKLWQNPQSVDTITILCLGVDGYATSYYMQPASIQGGSAAQQIMGFEETTATRGTVSPFGCEVLNNALYHPLDDELTKSTASNYNINHKSMTDLIKNKWIALPDKGRIISSQFENKLFYIVNNPDGEPVPEGCNGNEIWICDTALEGVWSRWLVPAVSLHKLEIGGKLYMGVVRPDSISVFDDQQTLDTVNDGFGDTVEVPIPWRFETNTQGANRAHDAWAFLSQVAVTFGDFQGSLEWGIRGWTDTGKALDIHKTYRDLNLVNPVERPLPWDQDDMLKLERTMKEWYFYAHSIEDAPSRGQINAVQYRYTPASVNIGTAYGSVETFEYERARVNWAQRTTDNGIPTPFIDTRHP